MSYRSLKSVLLACSGAAVLVAVSTAANAGGLALREQSAYGQGSSFAGVAAGGSLSSMFWNPATITQMPGIQFEAVLSGILPHASQTATASTFGAIPTFTNSVGNSGKDALVPSGYFSYQVNQQLFFGMSVNAPFGLSVGFPDNFSGRNYAADSSLKTYNFTPTIAYALNNWISVGFGVQFQYGKADYSNGIPFNGVGTPGGLGNQLNISGDGWGYGITAGVTLTPTPTTTIGIGYRSAINQKVEGTMTLPAGPLFTPAFGSTPGAVNTTLNLPDMVSVGLRQRVGLQWTVMGTVEWTNWSRIGTSRITQANGSSATIFTPTGPAAITLPFQYSDGWFYSLGAEYQWSPALALRAGIGYEKSPITDSVRTPRLPDNDRTWLSVGASYQITPKLGLDFAYSHLWVKNTPINLSATSGNPWYNGVTYIGSVSSNIDIISVGLKYRWDDPAPPPAKVGYFKAK